jgi:hypothetical protein
MLQGRCRADHLDGSSAGLDGCTLPIRRRLLLSQSRRLLLSQIRPQQPSKHSQAAQPKVDSKFSVESLPDFRPSTMRPETKNRDAEPPGNVRSQPLFGSHLFMDNCRLGVRGVPADQSKEAEYCRIFAKRVPGGGGTRRRHSEILYQHRPRLAHNRV